MTRSIAVFLLCLAPMLMIAIGCDDGGGDSGDADSDADSDADGDSDGDSDGDTDTCTMGTYEGDVELESEADLEQLFGYTAIDGRLGAFGAMISDYSGMECLTSISGELYIEACGAMTSLDGLDNLAYVHDLFFFGNGLIDITALGSLTTVEESFYIGGHMELTSLEGLESLTSVIQVLLEDNDALTSLDGLSGLTSIGGELGVWGNPALPDCEVCDLLDQLDEEPPYISAEDNLDDGCTPVPNNCEPVVCPGYTGDDPCCFNNNPCDWDLNDICDCDSTCAWDAVDCEW